MTSPLPSSGQPIASIKAGAAYVTPVWQRWFNSILGASTPFEAVEAGPSPYTFRALAPGNLRVTGGTVSSVVLVRGTSSLSVGSGFVPVSTGDQVRITYSSPPTVTFIPA